MTSGEKSGEKPVFHYDRRRRLAARGITAEAEKRKTGLFRRNPSLKILLLDILIILVLGLGMRFWLTHEKDAGKFAGYWVKLDALAVKDRLFVSLELDKPLSTLPLQETVEASFRLTPSETLIVKSLSLPVETGAPLQLEFTMPLGEQDTRLKLLLETADRRVSFSKRILR